MASLHTSKEVYKSPSVPSIPSVQPPGGEASRITAAAEFILSFPPDLQDFTPRKHGHHRTSKCKNEEYNEAVCGELGNAIYQVKGGWVRQLYKDLATDERIEEYLRMSSSGYNMEENCRTSLSGDITSEGDLRSSLVRIVAGIIDFFHPPLLNQPGVSRSAVDSHNALLAHDNGVHASRPSVCIQAAGPSFEVPNSTQGSQGLGYTNVASIIDARPDSMKCGRKEQAEVLAIYCR